ncbi:sesquipedalian-1-like [Brevipalpus obovatus]|uniref:sesquipedalian-1-like n=1 Tax=Brevipalpus obovatus TaxID=246614 RepID=UPI003D9E4A79
MKLNEKIITKFATNSSNQSDLEGYLLKKGEANRNLHKRWCVLRGNMFFYFERCFDKEPLGCIFLEGSRVELSESDSDYFAFRIVFTGYDKKYIFVTDNPESLGNWMKALSQASFSYLKMVISELQRRLDETNNAAVEQRKQLEEASQEKLQQQQLNPKTNLLIQNAEDLITLDESSGNGSSRKPLFSRKPFIELHQHYGEQVNNYLREIKSTNRPDSSREDLLS